MQVSKVTRLVFILLFITNDFTTFNNAIIIMADKDHTNAI